MKLGLIKLANKLITQNNTFDPLQFNQDTIELKSFFNKHQDLLLEIMNTPEFQAKFNIPQGITILYVVHNGLHWIEGFNNGHLIIKFRAWTGSEVANTLLPILTKIEIANEYKQISNKLDAALAFGGFRRNTYGQIYLKQYPTSASGDGHTASVAKGSWSAARDAANGDSLYTDSSGTTAYSITQPAADGGWRVDRAHFPADTSSIPDLANVKSGAFNVTHNGDHSAGVADSPTIYLDSSTQASGTALVDADYSRFGGSSQSDVHPGTGTLGVAGTAQSFTLNATGLTNISKTGYTKMMLRISEDFSNSAPTNSAGNTHQGGWYTQDHTTASQRPYYDIIYPIGGAFFAHMLNS